MGTYFNKKDLVEFGNYLLSEQRAESYLANTDVFVEGWHERLQERMKQVSHADVENFLHRKNQPVVIELTKHTPEQLEAVKNKIKKQFTV